ncbi:hypothetical protein Pmar_PMAR005257 [Perkinsus marinus ATCC 50983]|uniref:Uncharacterized protein n=1 Tax=Perkinsus marinus (strain ATCC 50983 / TXsc) TaxID=423536 RepID=C5KB21_PERM5|nr:hypothetical protein Pmar_PMAR005257 [Perkinsus marinus ATCC 50983]EER18347.1 hypothetical protein Pmar_PMAR005257 [Perkinsus marinus ATCC 50983]|eukprot:XP_002786551.1 hypothetical protein Pmar_PMAR005257 [Perkinsus marinus ATCC 50983]
MSSAALAFDAECSEKDWLKSTVSEASAENVAAAAAAAQQTDTLGSLSQTLRQVAGTMQDLASELRSLKSKSMVMQHFTTKRRTSVSGDPINPVFFCAQRPNLEQKIDALPVNIQVKFYDILDERLNLTHARATDEQVMELLTDVAKEASPVTPINSNIESSTEYFHTVRTSPTSHCGHGEPERCHSPSEVEPPHNLPSSAEEDNSLRDEDFSLDSFSTDDDSDMDEESSDEPLELPPRDDDPPASEPEYGDEPFTVFEGNIFDVVSEYLKSKPHYRLVNGCIEELKTKRKTCYLECRRTVSSRNEGREASKGAKPDWRLWPAFTCHLRRIKVRQNGPLCHMYPLRGVTATNEDWREHSHFPGTEDCRSARIPPDILDDWQIWLAEQPCIPTAQLKTKSRQKCIDGQYSTTSIEFITQKGLDNFEAVRSALRSIKKSRECGLSVEAFTRELRELACDAAELEGRVADIIRSIDAVEAGSGS